MAVEIPACPHCERSLSIENTDTFACYQCLERFDRLGLGRLGDER